ncbi:hypothetical protein GCM10011428_39300 [Streptomyces violaceus]
MDRPQPLDDALVATADAFERLRPRLFGIAYHVLGSVSEAEGVVQDVWVRRRPPTRRPERGAGSQGVPGEDHHPSGDQRGPVGTAQHRAVPLLQEPPDGGLWALRPAAEQLDSIAG